MPLIDTEKAVSTPTTPSNMPTLIAAAAPPDENTLDRVDTQVSAFYDSIPMWKKSIVVFTCSWGALTACFSSTSLLSASKEIGEDLDTASQVVTLSSAGLVFAMGMSALVWSPIASVSNSLCTVNHDKLLSVG